MLSKWDHQSSNEKLYKLQNVRDPFYFFFTLDIDECSANPCDKNADCLNTDGFFVCTCVQGFTGNGAVCEGTLLIFAFVCTAFWSILLTGWYPILS